MCSRVRRAIGCSPRLKLVISENNKQIPILNVGHLFKKGFNEVVIKFRITVRMFGCTFNRKW